MSVMKWQTRGKVLKKISYKISRKITKNQQEKSKAKKLENVLKQNQTYHRKKKKEKRKRIKIKQNHQQTFSNTLHFGD